MIQYVVEVIKQVKLDHVVDWLLSLGREPTTFSLEDQFHTRGPRHQSAKSPDIKLSTLPDLLVLGRCERAGLAHWL